MNDFINTYKTNLENTVKFLKEDLASLRTGRANPALVENILVEVYESKMPLKQLASITTPDSKTLLIQPWDKNLVREIEKAIASSSLGFGISVEGNFLRLSLPSLTEEKRKELIKILHGKLEQARIVIRGYRDKAREEVVEKERNKEISEDEKYRFFEELNKITSEFNREIKQIGEDKEREIATI
jgi:ribosome recycling factor